MKMREYTWTETFPVYEEGDKVRIYGEEGIFTVEWQSEPANRTDEIFVMIEEKDNLIPLRFVYVEEDE